MVTSPDKISQFYHNGSYSKGQDYTSVDRCGGQVTLAWQTGQSLPQDQKQT